MHIAKLLTILGLAMSFNPAMADDEALVIDRSISQSQALLRIHALFDKLCKPNPGCGVGVEKPATACPFLFIVIVPLPETAAKRSIAVWVSLDRRGHTMATSETREGACVGA